MTALEINKRCSSCYEFKNIDLFYRNKRSNDGRNCYCKPCSDIIRNKNKHKRNEARRLKRLHFREGNKEKHAARAAIGHALKSGLIKRPSKDRHWYNKYEFHHPDYARPYYGCWVTTKEHGAIHTGILALPVCTDYTEELLLAIFRKWNLQFLTEDQLLSVFRMFLSNR